MDSLYDMSLSAVCRLYDTPLGRRNITDVGTFLSESFHFMPESLKRDLCRAMKRLWMTDTPLPMDPIVFDCKHLDFNALDKFSFIMLTNLPTNDVPHFWPIALTGHVNFNYYEFWLDSSCSSDLPYVLCRDCFMKNNCPSDLTDDSDFDYADYWGERGWKFYNVTSHYGCRPEEFVETVVYRESSWCDFCVITPLFRLYDWSSCAEETSVHDNNNYDSDVSDESIVNCCNKTELYDPYRV